MRYLGLNVTKYVQDLYAENYKMLMKEIKEKLNKWRDILGSYTVKMSTVPKLIYRFNAISIQIQAGFFCGYQQAYSEMYMEGQRN